MTETENCGLKKPDGMDFVDINMINENMDLVDTHLAELNENKSDKEHKHDERYYTEKEIDERLKGKVEADEGDISNTKVSNITETTAAFPVPEIGDKPKVLWGKVKKWQQDCIAKFGNYILTSMIRNQQVNSTSNIPSSALVYLMQQAITDNSNRITQLNGDITITDKDYVGCLKIKNKKLIYTSVLFENISITNTYGNLYWTVLSINIPKEFSVNGFHTVHFTPFAETGLFFCSLRSVAPTYVEFYLASSYGEVIKNIRICFLGLSW